MFRIKEYPKGFVVEIKRRKWYGKTYWTHYVSVFGIDSMPWYHSTYDFAMDSLLKKVKWDTIWGSRQA